MTPSLSAARLRAAYATGETTPVDVLEAVLERIAQDRTRPAEQRINAFTHVDEHGARDAARRSARRWQAGEPLGPGDGIPVALKDIVLAEGWPSWKGSATQQASFAAADSPIAARLRAAGAVFVGSTTLPEFGCKGVTDSRRHGVTRNPLDARLTAGGSSGGSAAALAGSMACWAVGSDGGGSIRIPAAFTATCGLKPTHGAVPYWPPSPSALLSHAGPMATTMADLSELFELIAGADRRDPMSVDLPHDTGPGDRPLRVAVWSGAPGTSAATAASVEHALDCWAASGAVQVEHLHRPPHAPCLETFEALWLGAAALMLSWVPEADRELLDPFFRAGAERGAARSAVDIAAALAARSQLAIELEVLLGEIDLLVTPTVAIEPFEAGRNVPDGWPSAEWTSWSPYTYAFNLTGQPALSVPGPPAPDGRPVGIQLVGRRMSDRMVIRAGIALEAALAGRDEHAGVGRR